MAAEAHRVSNAGVGRRQQHSAAKSDPQANDEGSGKADRNSARHDGGEVKQGKRFGRRHGQSHGAGAIPTGREKQPLTPAASRSASARLPKDSGESRSWQSGASDQARRW